MPFLAKILFLIVAFSTIYDSQGQGIMAKQYFRYFERVSLWGRTVFRIKHSIVEDCAMKCLDMDGRCKSFVFSRITGNCYGLSYDLSDGKKHAKRSAHYDLYCTISTKVYPYWKAKKAGLPPPPFVSSSRRRVVASPRRGHATLPPPTPMKPTIDSRIIPTSTDSSGVCVKEAPMILYMASSYFWQYTPDNAEPKDGTGWLANMNDDKQYLEMDIRDLKDVASITTYGATYRSTPEYLTSYKIQFLSERMGEWSTYQENGKDKIFEGNKDQNHPTTHRFPRGDVTALKIRIVPVAYKKNIMLRATANVYC